MGNGGYQSHPPLRGPLTSPAKPQLPYDWQLATFVDECHPKIQEMMDPFLVKFRGQCLLSNILTASGKQFDSLPKLDRYQGGVYWLHFSGVCPYCAQCSFIAGHVVKGALTDEHADEVVAALQGRITTLMGRTAGGGSPSGKPKWQGGGRGSGRPSPPPPGTTQMLLVLPVASGGRNLPVLPLFQGAPSYLGPAYRATQVRLLKNYFIIHTLP